MPRFTFANFCAHCDATENLRWSKDARLICARCIREGKDRPPSAEQKKAERKKKAA